MKQIFLSVLSIGLISFAGYKATTAFFSDSETSQNNSFQAGAIDLKIHNQSYIWRNNQWEYNQDNSWALQDILPQFTYFNFTDVKPGDLSQDTVELQVDTNPAWVCADITLTESAENEVLEPESTDGDDASDGAWDGELDQELQFIFWADDGDYTLEVDEPILHQGNLASLPQGDGNGGISLPIIDSQTNPWATVGQPMSPGPDGKIWIGKAWCHGTLTTNPQPEADGISQQRPASIFCNGEAQTNISQTDSFKGDISFNAIQSRNNESFVCETSEPAPTPIAQGTLAKNVVAGEIIAYVIPGASACSSGGHLHFEVMNNAQNVNPANYLSDRDVIWDNSPDLPFSFGGDWEWPLIGNIRITQSYGNTPYSSIFSGNFHTGIDMMSDDLSVRAVESGVLYEGEIPCGGGALKYVKVDHGLGLSTVYMGVSFLTID